MICSEDVQDQTRWQLPFAVYPQQSVKDGGAASQAEAPPVSVLAFLRHPHALYRLQRTWGTLYNCCTCAWLVRALSFYDLQ